ncbi:hypothetical protein LI99_31385 [Mycolicibacterium smegmatis]|uniref:Uncharacterized protein n=2 Tax=Mycolicibacterium smegmatis (strain ATCC 700084 / mc(2)155) TaxID=246196 RepID=A0R5X6_MYCS2|nr:hypothetical protein MSMEG_6347 [Mycolicibacterium smegmatis MC2 155]AIU17957.1 hypothetical protein LI99_31385 [Mycolicibacterium smegmatis]AFP42610.1 hypothetical protein MSMEI_6181 [Mycolicibacterium smegmatis MC2 155]AIU11333.1 hypothetical protein LJ00_31380 [Mycolicibacterium smegmatis MC2 155]AIU24581.1 hypothetical protein LI98_31390 [Mycolicibacterium smegmatis]
MTSRPPSSPTEPSELDQPQRVEHGHRGRIDEILPEHRTLGGVDRPLSQGRAGGVPADRAQPAQHGRLGAVGVHEGVAVGRDGHRIDDQRIQFGAHELTHRRCGSRQVAHVGRTEPSALVAGDVQQVVLPVAQLDALAQRQGDVDHRQHRRLAARRVEPGDVTREPFVVETPGLVVEEMPILVHVNVYVAVVRGRSEVRLQRLTVRVLDEHLVERNGLPRGEEQPRREGIRYLTLHYPTPKAATFTSYPLKWIEVCCVTAYREISYGRANQILDSTRDY